MTERQETTTMAGTGNSYDLTIPEIVEIGPIAKLPGRGRHFCYHLCHEVSEDVMYDIYVGVTSNLRARMRDHSTKWWWAQVNSVEFIEAPTRARAEKIERELIDLYNPDLNVSLGVGRKQKVRR